MNPGDQVLCVDDSPPTYYRGAPRLNSGATYTVLEAVNRHGVDGLLLEEARYPHALGQLEHGWLARRFVPASNGEGR